MGAQPGGGGGTSGITGLESGIAHALPPPLHLPTAFPNPTSYPCARTK